MPSRTLVLVAALCAGAAAQSPVRLRVDATDVTRRIVHVQMSMPAKPGPLSLLYPEWIPGEHGPTGPVVNLVGLKITAAGKVVPWKRDDANMYEFHVDVPAGATSLDIAFDFLSAPESEGFSSGASSTSELAVLSWNQLLLYPRGVNEDAMQYQATLKVPQSWRYGTALPIQRESGNEIEFQPASITTMVDSPISMGRHYRTIDLGAGNGIPHYLNLAADSDHALDIAPETLAGYKKLVQEAGALFGGSRHYRDYHFLFTLSDHIAHFGLEHHESSDDRYNERTLLDPEPRTAFGYLLPHEFVHSWNGKYRRPAGLVSGGKDGGYDVPMKGDLLWVYEGLTNYLGEVLTRRSGLWSPDEYRDYLAYTAADMDNTYGRRWRPLEDTAVAAQILYEAGNDYQNYRRSVDYYPEGSLIWLDVDVTIRRLSKGARSLDDFCKTFHGGPGGAPALKPYTFGDVVAALNAVQPNDWAAFLNERIRSTSDRAPLAGIENAGWKLTYDGVRSEMWKALEADHKLIDLTYSLGMKVKEDDGSVLDVRYGGPAQKAGIAPSVKLVAVNSRQYTPTVLREAVAAAKAVDLLIKTGDYYETHHIDYSAGERYPHLVRIEDRDDLLTLIVTPAAK